VALVLSDIVMPGGENGYDLARWLATHRPQVRLLLTSGYHDASFAGTADLPAAPFLAKPFSYDQLARAVRQALDGASITGV
jgi:DNA-binding NtrC family response regulator